MIINLQDATIENSPFGLNQYFPMPNAFSKGPSKTITALLSNKYFNLEFGIDSGAGGLPVIDFSKFVKPLETPDLKLQLCNFHDMTMNKVGFFTPVKYGKDGEAVKAHGLKGRDVEFFDSYFSLGGKVAIINKAVSKKEGTGFFIKTKEPWYMIALKVISYATLIVPAFMLIGKAIARSMIQYKAHNLFVPSNESAPEQTYNKVNDLAKDLIRI